MSSISDRISDFSFSNFCFERTRFSVCSFSDWIWSACFFRRRLTAVSWAKLCSSIVRRAFTKSVSRLLFNSACAIVVPPASSNRSASSSSSRDKSFLLFSDRARPVRSPSSSSSNSSTLPWSSLIFFCSEEVLLCSSSSFKFTCPISNSPFFNCSSCCCLSFSRSIIVSCDNRTSPSSFRFIRSVSCRFFFSLSRQISKSSTCASSLTLIRDKLETFSSSPDKSNRVALEASEIAFISLCKTLILSSSVACSSCKFLNLFSVACFSFSILAKATSISSISFLSSEVSSSSLRFFDTISLLSSSSSSKRSWSSRKRPSISIFCSINDSHRSSASIRNSFWLRNFSSSSFFSCRTITSFSSSSIRRFFSFSSLIFISSNDFSRFPNALASSACEMRGLILKRSFIHTHSFK